MKPLVKVQSDLPKEESSLSWKENPAAKKLLDVLASLLAKEYVQTARENPEIFSK